MITILFSSLGTSASSSTSLIFFDITHEALGKALVIFLYVVFQVGTLSVALGLSVLLLLPDHIHVIARGGRREGREDGNDA